MGARSTADTILSTFNLSDAKKVNAMNKNAIRRSKLVKKLDEQILIAEAMLKGEEYIGTKTVITRDEDGETTRTKEPKRVNKWFYTNDGSEWYLEVKYGNRALQLAKDKTAILVGELDNMTTVIKQVKQAVLANELDAAIDAVATRKAA